MTRRLGIPARTPLDSNVVEARFVDIVPGAGGFVPASRVPPVGG